MRTLTTAVLCLGMLALAGCSKKDPQLSQLGGSQPQRLSFGSPQVVKAAFIKKMQVCWFSGNYPVLGGYQIDTAPALVQVSDGEAQLQQVAIYSGQGENAQVFFVQFSPFNENTLISTRSKSFPPELATRLRRDVETWIFGRSDCNPGAGPDSLTPQQTVQPLKPAEKAKPRVQQASMTGLPEAPRTNARATASSSQTALAKNAIY
ncbi:MAG: hypothetical protein P8Y67_11680 [Alphaproteobacteria bacterium]